MRLNFNTNRKEKQPTEREKYSRYVNRMKWILATCMLLLTWQDNICYCRASRFGLQRKLCFIKELIFPPLWRGRLEKVSRCTTWNRYLLKLSVSLVMALSLSLQNSLKLKPYPSEGNQYVLVGEITPFAPFAIISSQSKNGRLCTHTRWERTTPVNVKSMKNFCTKHKDDGVSLPPHALVSRHTKPEVFSRVKWTPHEGRLCPLWLWHRRSLMPQSFSANVSPRRCEAKCEGNTDIRQLI